MLEENYYRLALKCQEKIGNSLIKKLLQIFGSARAIFQPKAALFAQSQGWNRSIPFPKITPEVDRIVSVELKNMERYRIHISTFTEKEYPQRLLHCKDAPAMFFYKGNPIFNLSKSLAIVGTRSATSYGEDAVRKVLADFQGEELLVVSGMALGIDTIAHETALQISLPTVAVLGSGLGVIYPSANHKLAEKILEAGGAIISEFPFATLPDRQNFPQRNRIVAGMVDAIVVAETGVKGGSIITAELGVSYNRDVFAIPGSIFSSSQDGCNMLIRKNLAALVTSGKDIIEMMSWDMPERVSVQHSLFVELSEDEVFLVSLFSETSELSIDELMEAAAVRFKPSKVAALLLGLELNGVLECKPGKIFRVIQR